jgi:4'-phosphopantetheinyl transferase
MPVRFQKECSNGAHVLVWEAKESEVELLSILPSNILTDAEYLESKSPLKRLEFLTSRLAIRYLANQLNVNFDGLKKDIHGKPYLVNSTWKMSITHSKVFMGVIMHPSKEVGIDIELPQKKMWKILPRLFSEQEIIEVGKDIEKMSVYWSAKEALYKLYGKRGVDFKDNLLLHQKENDLIGEIKMEDYHAHHQLLQERIDDYLLVWAV